MRGPVPRGRGAPSADDAGHRGESEGQGSRGYGGIRRIPGGAGRSRGGAAEAGQAGAGRGGKHCREAPGWDVGVGMKGGGSDASGGAAIS